MNNSVMNEIFGEIISIYSREQALEDGVLVDVSKTAKEAGFKFPVAVTSALWGLINDIPKSHSHQDTEGRLWDVLFMAAFNSRRGGGSIMNYQIIMHHNIQTRAGKRVKTYLDLKAICGPGDNGEPVITIMLSIED
jgi:hypothetical protein